MTEPLEYVALVERKLNADRAGLDLLDHYYRGTQPAAFLHPEVAADVAGRLKPLRINWPRVVLDAIHERLRVVGFRRAGNEQADAELWETWQANNLDLGHKLATRSALKHGRSFLLVWSDPTDRSVPQISLESAKWMGVYRDALGRPEAAVKRWDHDGVRRANVYTKDVLLKLSTERIAGRGLSLNRGGWYVLEEAENDLNVLPVFPLVNRPDLDLLDGESELEDIGDIADAINKLATDMMVSAEYHAIPRRWATGTEAPIDPVTGQPVGMWEQLVNRVWIAPEEGAKIGQLPEAELTNFTGAMSFLASQIAALGKVPPHYLGLQGDNPASADAIRSAEASLISTAKDKHDTFSDPLEGAMALATVIRNGGDVRDVRLETMWMDPETPTKAQAADAAVKLVTATPAIISVEQAQEDLGYSPGQRARMAVDLRRARFSAAGMTLAPAFSDVPGPTTRPATPAAPPAV